MTFRNLALTTGAITALSTGAVAAQSTIEPVQPANLNYTPQSGAHASALPDMLWQIERVVSEDRSIDPSFEQILAIVLRDAESAHDSPLTPSIVLGTGLRNAASMFGPVSVLN